MMQFIIINNESNYEIIHLFILLSNTNNNFRCGRQCPSNELCELIIQIICLSLSLCLYSNSNQALKPMLNKLKVNKCYCLIIKKFFHMFFIFLKDKKKKN